MVIMVDVEPIVIQLYKEMDEVSLKSVDLNDKVKEIKAECNSLDGFICNFSYIINTLCEAAYNEQKQKSLNHFINLIEIEANKGEKDAGSL